MKREKVEFFDNVLKNVGKKSNLFGSNTLIEIEDEKPVQESVVPGQPVMVKGMNGSDFMKSMWEKYSKEPATIPTLEDIKTSNVDIYNKYLTSDNTLTIYVPEHLDSDLYGFRSIEIKSGYKNLKTDVITLVGDKLDIYDLIDEHAMWIFRQNHKLYKKMYSVNPGEKFTYSKEKFCRLSEQELNDLIDNKILLDGGVDIAPKKKGVENLGDGLFSISF